MNHRATPAWPRRLARSVLPLGWRRRLRDASHTGNGLALRVLAATHSIPVTLAARRRGVIPHLNELLRVGSLSGGLLTYLGVTVRLRPGDIAAAWHLLHTAPQGWSVIETGGAYAVTVRPGDMEFVVPVGMLADAMGSLIERFLLDEYAGLDVEDAVVVDIGAYIGDSAVDMLRRGARRVYSYEPFPELAELARTNAHRNHLADVVTVASQGVGWPAGPRRASFRRANSMMSETVSSGGGDVVEIISFAEVLDGVLAANPGCRLVCKIDCEGAEREFFTPDRLPPSFASVDALALEWHDADPGPVIADLSGRGLVVTSVPTATEPGAPTMIFARRPAALDHGSATSSGR